MRKRKFLLIVFLLTVTVNVMARTNGRITDKTDGTPIVGALVQVKDTNMSAFTDSDGCYDFGENLYAETIIITAEGYNVKKAAGDPDMIIQLDRINWWTEKPNWQIFVGIQGLMPTKSLEGAAPGLMVGFVKTVGVYAQIFYRPGKSEEEGFDRYITNGKTAYRANGYLGGFMFRFNRPIYLYAGFGVTTLEYYAQDIHSKWGMLNDWGENIATAQLGLMFKYKMVSVNGSALYRFLDYSSDGRSNYSLSFKDHLALNVGVAYWF